MVLRNLFIQNFWGSFGKDFGVYVDFAPSIEGLLRFCSVYTHTTKRNYSVLWSQGCT